MSDGFILSRIGNGATLTDRVYSNIKEAILELRLKPGSPLVEDELARQLGTSKTPVRDALLSLEREGLVSKIAYKGTYVTEVSMRDATEIFELRAVLEGLAARCAARSFSPAELDEAERLLDQADVALAAGDFDGASRYGANFHKLIHNHADNRRLGPILERLEEQLRRLRRLSDRGPGRLQKSGTEHRRILAGLRAADSRAAEEAMRAHLESVLHDFDVTEDDDPTLPAAKESLS